MGMAMVGSRMLAVTDTGGLFEIRNYAAPESAVANYLESSAELLGIRFSGLTVAPRGLENGRFSNLLFGIDSRGGLHAFTTDGELQEVFSNGQSSVNTGIGGANGLAFSSLQENLWHITDQRAGDPGHNGGNSFRFGDDDRNIYFPGGAHGSLVSQPFSLQGVSADEQPTLYFSYFYGADEAPNEDAFRVYISDDSREDSQGQWHLLASSPVGMTDNDPTDNINVDVQTLFANTWQDVPRLRRPGEDNVPGTDSPGAPDVNIGVEWRTRRLSRSRMRTTIAHSPGCPISPTQPTGLLMAR